jgi:hypothetical protein
VRSTLLNENNSPADELVQLKDFRWFLSFGDLGTHITSTKIGIDEY